MHCEGIVTQTGSRQISERAFCFRGSCCLSCFTGRCLGGVVDFPGQHFSSHRLYPILPLLGKGPGIWGSIPRLSHY